MCWCLWLMGDPRMMCCHLPEQPMLWVRIALLCFPKFSSMYSQRLTFQRLMWIVHFKCIVGFPHFFILSSSCSMTWAPLYCSNSLVEYLVPSELVNSKAVVRGLETLMLDIFASFERVMCFRNPHHCCGCLGSWPCWTQRHFTAAEPPERFLCEHIRWVPPDPPRANRSHLFWPSAPRGPAVIWGGELLHRPLNKRQIIWHRSCTGTIFFPKQSFKERK